MAARDTDTDEVLWSFSSGPPLTSYNGLLLEDDEESNATSGITGDPAVADEEFIFCGTDWKLYSYDKRFGTEDLPISPDDLVKKTPAVLDGAIVLGSFSTSAFLVDANSGTLVREFGSGQSSAHPEGRKTEDEKRITEPRVQESKDVDYLLIVRKDYSISSVSTGSGVVLWNVSLGELRLHYVESDDIPRLPQSKDAILDAGFLQNVHSNRGGKLTSTAYPPRLIPIPTTPETFGIPIRPLVSLPESQKSEERNATPSFPMALALPSADKNIDRFVPTSVFENLESVLFGFLGRRYFWIGFLLLFTAFLVVGIWGAASLYFKLVRKPSAKEKQVSVGRRKKGRKGHLMKQSDMMKELVIAERALPRGSLPEKTINDSTNESPLGQANDMLTSGNLMKDRFDHGEGCAVGSLFVKNTAIGYGSHGTVVFEGFLDKRNVAVKRLLCQFYEKAEKEIANLIASDEHPNVVRCHAMEVDANFVYVALERCSFSLHDLVRAQSLKLLGTAEKKSLPACTDLELKQSILKVGDTKDYGLWDDWARPSSKLLQFMRDILAGLSHLHDLGIVHRDLKPRNVLISSGRISRAKLSDMGISKRLVGDASTLDTQTTGLGSSGWQAPEQLLNQRQTRSVDLFSLGCVLFFCVSGGQHPFGSDFERDRNILKGQPDLFPVEHVPEAVHLLSSLLETDPGKRPTVKDTMVHPLFWTSDRRIWFLRDASDRIEMEDREKPSAVLEDLEAASSAALGCSWDEKLDGSLLENLGRYRRYNPGSVRDLLRVIRNKSNHYRELPQDVQLLVGPFPEGFDNYFRNKFPRLLLEVYKIVQKHCWQEDLFQTYFALPNGLDWT